ncbi:MAG TPA: ribose-5-phosphate isomerase RpiA [Candidatus Dormibacteraeota bacterium]|nr:ribose-5-phosphate isomerase RpiA [Candidatus Dormibacteraeota bacterium]
MSLDVDAAKRAAGEAAAELVEDGMTLGLGTGSTARWFIAAVGRRVREGMRLRGVPTSRASEAQAMEEGIPVVELDASGVDLAVDGADAVDRRLRVIKGAGAALLREKIVATAARRFVVVVDEGKLRDPLSGLLPVELVHFGHRATLARLDGCGGTFRLRHDATGQPVQTDNGNLIADGDVGPIVEPESLGERIDSIPGVVGHGLFCGLTSLVLVARADGGVDRLTAD